MGIPPVILRTLGAALPVLVSLVFLSGVQPAAAQHFTSCLTSANNSTVFVSDSVAVTLGDGQALDVGDEIAVFTDDGDCAGVVTWEGTNAVISAAGEVDFEPDSTGGFAPGELLQFRVWDASEQTVFEAGSEAVAFVPCTEVSPCSHDDGRYRTDAFMHLAAIDAASALPVELTSFTARSAEARAVLTWTTATESNNAGFEVQVQPADASAEDPSWTALGFVEGQGTTGQPQTYRYETNELAVGAYRFRLKQVDTDGAFAYSPIVEVTLALASPYALSAAYPNPFRTQAQLTLVLARGQDVQVVLYNTLGQRVALVHEGPLTLNTEHVLAIEGRGLPSGLYFVQVRGDSFRATRRITLVK